MKKKVLSKCQAQDEPDSETKDKYWKIAIGLQDVDHLKTSSYLKKLAKANISGKLSIKNVYDHLIQHYKSPIELIKNNPKITANQLASNLNTSIRTIRRQLNKLKEDGILTRVGSDKNGSWKINDK